MENRNVMILGNDNYYSLDCMQTQRNNNVLVVGTSGAGKTRSIVSPNIMMATGSYIVTDPKGNLHKKYKNYLEKKGYVVKKLDFTDPMNSDHYNFLSYIREPRDIVKAANMIASETISKVEPFWDQSAELLLSAVIAYCIEALPPEKQNFSSLLQLICLAKRDYDSSSSRSVLTRMMEAWEKEHPSSWAVKQFASADVAPDRTYNSILITLTAKLRSLSSEEITYMMSSDDIDITSIGTRPTALFVVVSDTDRSMDNMVNLFFTQAMNELCWYADHECQDSCLPVPVRFFMDDFATNCRIDEFPRMIASIRSRGISAMLMVQAESQLSAAYGDDGRTIIGNCDTYIYLGGTDIETAKMIAERCNLPVNKVLNMAVGSNIVFRRGEQPKMGRNIDLNELEKKVKFKSPKLTESRPEEKKSLRDRLLGPARSQEDIEKEMQDDLDFTILTRQKKNTDPRWLFT